MERSKHAALEKREKCFDRLRMGYAVLLYVFALGVNDDAEPVGLEPDFATWNKPNKQDAFENWFTGLLHKHIGVPETASHLSAGFEEVGELPVFRVDVTAGDEPAYVAWEGGDRFFVRTNNNTREMTTKEAAAYIKKHWA